MRRRIRMFAAAVVFVASAPTIRGVGALASVETAVTARVATPCSWHVVATPDRNPRHMDNFLRDVAVVSADDVWAIGEAYVPEEGGRDRSLILHWDGSRWKAIHHPQGSDDGLLAVAGSSPSDVWVVGFGHPQGLVMHWDGEAWRRVQAVDPGTRFWHFTDVSAIGPNDVWAVGVTVDNGIGSTLIEQ